MVVASSGTDCSIVSIASICIPPFPLVENRGHVPDPTPPRERFNDMRHPAKDRQRDKIETIRSHPTRVKALSILSLRTASASDLGRILGIPASSIAHHLKVLEDIDAIAHVETKTVNGGKAKVYQAIASPTLTIEDVEQLSDADNYEARALSIETAYGSIRRALDSGAIRRPDTHITHSEWTFDPQAWRELHDLLDEVLLEHAPRLQEESIQRGLDDVDLPLVHGALNLQLYETGGPE